ncbi:RHS repeat-associated core domain-containing protein [Kribbella sindirgiensis]|uniref:Insecticide toxin TcdB middle/N-terminal domain-containing protein n=1 Tax=Kribbella sindirgiensis TaxID=1124744 RepID=A0A4R0J1B8_9ACTN|nr:RHS repeat-associated core domain-containing protein [Kribbella sindirgiensis]TCC34935.1 hypothetical protein E0H50_13675 [Kribbella sindirgiensis]
MLVPAQPLWERLQRKRSITSLACALVIAVMATLQTVGTVAGSAHADAIVTTGPLPQPNYDPIAVGSQTATVSATSTPMGGTSGSFTVGENGEAQYEVPLQVVPGRGGFQPRLSLSYRSGGGNSQLGKGFTLSGLALISRCAKTVVDDGIAMGVRLDSTDRFCLGGKRLVPVSGTYGADGAEYRTKPDSHVRIRSYKSSADAEGPTHFKVWLPDGTVQEYGLTGESTAKVYVDGPAGYYANIAWNLSKATDRSGNTITYSYGVRYRSASVLSEVERWISRIAYGHGSTLDREVTFGYETRPDRLLGFALGERRESTKRLTSITMSSYKGAIAGWAQARSYSLEYLNLGVGKASKLWRLKECGTVQTECKLPTVFSWSPGYEGLEAPVNQTSTTGASLVPSSDESQLITADFTGDGRTDLAWPEGNELGEKKVWKHVDASALGGYSVVHEGVANPFKRAATAYAVDYDIDGMVDLMPRSAAITSYRPILSRPGDVHRMAETTFYGGFNLLNNSASNSGALLGDFDGDGYQDVLEYRDPKSTSLPDYQWQFRRRTGEVNPKIDNTGPFSDPATRPFDDKAFSAPTVVPWLDNVAPDKAVVLDLEGDGRDELLWEKNPSGDLSLSDPAAPTPGVKYTRNLNASLLKTDSLFLDLNGDGLLDVVNDGVAPNDKGRLFYQLNTGLGFSVSEATSIVFKPGSLKAAKVFDYDSDGRQDLLLPHWGGTAFTGMDVVRAATSTSGSVTLSVTPQVVSFAPKALDTLVKQERVVDANGDGHDDLLLVDRPATGPAALKLWLHNGSRTVTDSGPALVKQDLLTKVTEGSLTTTTPASVSITYSTLSDTEVYNRGPCPRTPYQMCMVGGTYVVKQLLTDAGLHDNPSVKNTARYEYRAGRLDKKARAFLGFAEIRVHDKSGFGGYDPGLRRTFYSNTVPQKDPRPVETWTVNALPGGKYAMQRTNLEWQDRSTVAGSYFPYVTLTKERTYEYAIASCVPCHADWTPAHFDSLGKAPYVTVTETVSGMDEYGNARFLVSDTSDTGGSASTTTTEVIPDVDTAEWLVSRADKVITTDTRHEGVDSAQTRITEYEYKPLTSLVVQRRVSGGSLPGGNVLVETFGHDAEGNVIRIESLDEKTGESVEATAVYDPYGYPHAMMNALGHIVRTGHDQVTGLRKVLVDANGLRSDFTYDTLGRTVKARTPAGAQTNVVYSSEPSGQEVLSKARITLGTGAVSEVLTDRLGRAVVERFKGFDGTMRIREAGYDSRGRLISTTLPRPLGATTSPEKVTYTYDDLGRPVSQKDPAGGLQTWSYENLNVSYTDADGRKKQTFGNARGETTRTVDGGGSSAETARKYEYGPFGNLTKTFVEGVSGSTSTFTYDAQGHQLTSKDSERGTTVNTFNAFGEVVTSTDALGRLTTTKRDAVGRVVERSVTQNGIGRSHSNFFYDSIGGAAVHNGKLMRAVLLDGGESTSITNTYDSMSRLSSAEYTLPVQNDPQDQDLEETFRIGYDYDAQNRVTGVRYPALPGQVAGALVAYEYGGNGRLGAVKVTEPAAEAATIWTAKGTDAQDRLVTHESGDGTKTSRTLDWRGSVRDLLVTTSEADADPSRELFNEEYSYSLAGNLTARSRRDPNNGLQRELFGYDALNRVSSQVLSYTLSSGQPVTQQTDDWAYDKLGNLTKSKRRGSYGYDPARPTLATSVTGGIFGNRAFSYDAVGNQIARPGEQVTYNDFNLPSKSLSAKNGDSTFLYYPDGERARKQTTKEIVTTVPGLYERHTTAAKTQHRLLVQADGATVAALEYDQVTGQADVAKQPTLHLHADRQGTTSLVTADDLAGGLKAAVREARSYDTFGKLRNPDWRLGDAGYTQGIQPATVDQGYTGHEDDRDTGLINMGGRMYDPALGKFLTPDPNVDGANATQAWNGYTYVSNNPHRYTDPSGFKSCMSHCSLPDHVWGFVNASQMFWNSGAWGISPMNPDSPEGGKRFESEMERYYERQYERDFGSGGTEEATPSIDGTATPEDTLVCADGPSGPSCSGVGVAPEVTVQATNPVNDWGHTWCGPGIPCGLESQMRAEAWATELERTMNALVVEQVINWLSVFGVARGVGGPEGEPGVLDVHGGNKKIPPVPVPSAVPASPAPAQVAPSKVDSMSATGQRPDQGNLTQAGRSYQKHMARGELPQVPGKELNRAGQDLLDGILTDPHADVQPINKGVFNGGTRVISNTTYNDRFLGAAFNASGEFQYFGTYQ